MFVTKYSEGGAEYIRPVELPHAPYVVYVFSVAVWYPGIPAL